MIRIAMLTLTLTLAACATTHEDHFATTSEKDPTWRLNPDKWPQTVNNLLVPVDVH
jgi:hypothetical protein